MKIKILLTICFLVFWSFGMRKVNSRYVPEAVPDFVSEGSGQRYLYAESLFVELANILDATRNSDKLDVSKITTDSIGGSPIFTGTITDNRINTDTLRVGATGSTIIKIVLVVDTLKFFIGADSAKITIRR